MSIDDLPRNPLPVWMKVLIIVCCLPVLAFPWLLELCPPESSAEIFLWLYIPYVALAGWCAWRSWASRPEVSWIILFVLILTHAAMWVLVNPAILLP